jgi:predicted RNA polymerase sigma factor
MDIGVALGRPATAYRPRVELGYPGIASGEFTSAPQGVILHGSRSGIDGNAMDAQYVSTVRYAVDEPDRHGWHATIGADVLQAALARDRLGEFQAQAAIAALHADAQTVEATDWVQIVEWYDELVRLTDSPVARLNRAVAVGEAQGPRAGLTALAELDTALPRYAAVAAYLHERDGDVVTAVRLYAEAARSASSVPERDHLTRQAAQLNAHLRP